MAKIPILDLSHRSGANRILPDWGATPARSTRSTNTEVAVAQALGASIEADPFNIFILNYTMKCPLACDYCCYTCGPKRPETMDFDLAMKLVDQAADLGVFTECGFTGGEPLVYLDEVLAITARMAKRGLPFSMISACDWATDAATTRRYIDSLVERGLSVFTISHDPSHERWVPREHVSRVMDRVLEQGVRAVMCGSFYDDSVDLRTMFPEYVDNPNVSFVSRVVLPKVGRSSQKKIDAELYPHVDLRGGDTCYKRFFHDVTVFWDGEVYPCCSVYNRDTPGISYGNVYDTPLVEIWDRIAGSLFLRMIKRDGFTELLRFLQERAPDLTEKLPDASRAIGPCHLCNLIMKDPLVSDRVHQIFADLERERVSTLLGRIRTGYGETVASRLVEQVIQS
jgi:organic radical activating enzyme